MKTAKTDVAGKTRVRLGVRHDRTLFGLGGHASIVRDLSLTNSKVCPIQCRALKAFASRRSERCRPAYGRFVVERPRQYIMVGRHDQRTRNNLRDPDRQPSLLAGETRGIGLGAPLRGCDEHRGPAAPASCCPKFCGGPALQEQHMADEA
jgi:virulence-associated protein E